jgi:hypothetical protein
MSKKLAYAITDNNISVNFDNQTHIISRSDALAEKLIQALREGRKDDIPELISASKRIEQYGQGAFSVSNGLIFVNGQPVHEVLSRKILKFQAEGLPHQPLVKFAENLQKNPSFRAVTELFQFLEKNDHPITDEGNFIAYKRVRSDFKDIHSGTFDNSVGVTVEMPRNQVNEDSTQTCSNGLHVANWTYAHTQFASHNPSTDLMLEVEVNPENVVSIPVDYDQSKMRVSKYKVLGVVDKEHSTEVQLRNTSFNDCSNECCDHSELEEASYCEICDCECEPGYNVCENCELDSDKDDEDDEDEDDDYPFHEELDV